MRAFAFLFLVVATTLESPDTCSQVCCFPCVPHPGTSSLLCLARAGSAVSALAACRVMPVPEDTCSQFRQGAWLRHAPRCVAPRGGWVSVLSLSHRPAVCTHSQVPLVPEARLGHHQLCQGALISSCSLLQSTSMGLPVDRAGKRRH